MSNFYKEVNAIIDQNLEGFINHFFPGSSVEKISKSYRVNPAPCCGHRDCFSFAIDKNAANCYSCGTRGSRLAYMEQILGKMDLIEGLENFTGLAKPHGEASDAREVIENEESKHVRRMNEIYDYAVNFYCKQLAFSSDPISQEAKDIQLSDDYENGGRGHSILSILNFKVGFSLDNYDELEAELRNQGYTDEELKEARKLIWVPPYYFIYPYFSNGELKRLNCKAFKLTCRGTRKSAIAQDFNYDCLTTFYAREREAIAEHEREHNHMFNKPEYSTGDREGIFFTKTGQLPPQQPRKLILVEGDDDVISVHENMLVTNERYEQEYVVKALGGNPSEDTLKSPEIKFYEEIYTLFDNDETGKMYRDRVNNEIADALVYEVVYPPEYKDPDIMLRVLTQEDLDELSLNIETLIAEAVPLDTEHIVATKQSGAHKWFAKNRNFTMEFDIERFAQRTAQFEGAMSIERDGRVLMRATGALDKIRCGAIYDQAKFRLSDVINEYYNGVPWGADSPVRDFKELIDILRFSRNYQTVIKQIAWYMYHANKDVYEEKYKYLARNIKDDVVIGEILKEVNGYSNSEFDPDQLLPRITLSQYFNIGNDDAYFYFSRKIQDGDTVKLVPYLINNRKEETRLDLIKRKDPQCLLLLDNKYEIPMAVETAPLDPSEVSLQSYWVDKWKNGEVTPEELDPLGLINEIESFIDRIFFTEESTRKVLALWIMCTYYYMLFKSGFPYLMFNGPKGTGKSTLDLIVYLLALNAKLALDISSSAMYRTITSEGGTFILDEIENLGDKKSADGSDFATLLKGGYADSSQVYRTNTEKGGITERFSVFGPKVISNINGLDDVIADRCIVIRTFRTKTDNVKNLENPQLYKEEKRHEVHSITSRCALSAMHNFQTVHALHNSSDTYLDTGNARLSQIIKPLMTMAQFVGGDYKRHLLKFYKSEIEVTKTEIASGTVEGMVYEVLRRVADELTNFEPDKWATIPQHHSYTKPIKYSVLEDIFEIDSMHVKVLVESLNGGENIDLKDINATIKMLLGPDFDLKERRKQTTATINDDELRRRLNGSKTVKVYRYYLKARDFSNVPVKYVEGDDKKKRELF